MKRRCYFYYEKLGHLSRNYLEKQVKTKKNYPTIKEEEEEFFDVEGNKGSKETL